MLYKLINVHNEIFDKYFSFNRSVTRGHSYKLLVPRISTEFGRKSFLFRPINKWNSLSETVVTSSSLSKFKCQYDMY